MESASVDEVINCYGGIDSTTMLRKYLGCLLRERAEAGDEGRRSAGLSEMAGYV